MRTQNELDKLFDEYTNLTLISSLRKLNDEEQARFNELKTILKDLEDEE